MDKEHIMTLAIDIYGENTQKIKAIEEMSELTKELAKDIVGSGDRAHIVEELTDVLIMAKQLKIIYKVSESELKANEEYKLARLLNRLDQYY